MDEAKYNELARSAQRGELLRMRPPIFDIVMKDHLDEIDKHEVDAGRPLLSSILVVDGKLPPPAFFQRARDLGRFTGPDTTQARADFAAREQQQVFDARAARSVPPRPRCPRS